MRATPWQGRRSGGSAGSLTGDHGGRLVVCSGSDSLAEIGWRTVYVCMSVTTSHEEAAPNQVIEIIPFGLVAYVV